MDGTGGQTLRGRTLIRTPDGHHRLALRLKKMSVMPGWEETATD